MSPRDTPTTPEPADIRLALEVPRAPSAAEVARQALDAYRNVLTATARDDARLVLTELVANSVRHGKGDVVGVNLRLDVRGALHGEVVDQGCGFEPPSEPAGELKPCGRGLPIVAALVDEWGVEAGATRVWFRMGRACAGPWD